MSSLASVSVFCVLVFVCGVLATPTPVKQPNIVFVLADDYGYADVSYHASQSLSGQFICKNMAIAIALSFGIILKVFAECIVYFTLLQVIKKRSLYLLHFIYTFARSSHISSSGLLSPMVRVAWDLL